MGKKEEVVKQEKYDLMVDSEQQFYDDVRLILKRAREQAYDSANGIMTFAYWNVGRRIVQQEQYGEKKAKYGSYLLKIYQNNYQTNSGQDFLWQI